jgi:hypothetical protein
MRSLIVGVIASASLGYLVSSASAMGVATGDILNAAPQQGLIEQAQYDRYCARLRRACEFKSERGEVGEGNCRRYRQDCGGRASYCERLRRACIYKEERGEVGEGNCRRYRNECGGYGR